MMNRRQKLTLHHQVVDVGCLERLREHARPEGLHLTIGRLDELHDASRIYV